jgi:16S rRNA (uracil1498-N3)-methyltransferase
MDNLYLPSITTADQNVIPGPEAQRHIAALRLRDGERVRVLNGKGLVVICSVVRDAAGVLLRAHERQQHEQPQELCLAIGVLDNRDRFEFAVEKATELGVTRIIPLLCDHSQFVRSNHDRLCSKAVAAITQSGNPWLPHIDQPTRVDDLIFSGTVILGDADGDAPKALPLQSRMILVGPEGGFSQRELDHIQKTLHPIRWRIGHNRLRAETAAIALIGNAVLGTRD